ncbi:MAG: hypothetical protein PHU33_15940 [Bacteroidales bacterium]|nr:hypothetical protein [Bacteroidales bacterium]
MTKREFKEATERFQRMSQFISQATSDTIVRESEENRQARIKNLLLPENYGYFFNHYLGKDTVIPLADSDCAWYHLSSYEELYRENFITQFRIIFRGGAKSIHSNVGNPLALKLAGKIKFFLVIGANEDRAKLLLADLQVQFEANKRLINDFGNQIGYGSWADGMFETSDKCYFMALGIDQPFRGLRHYANRIDMASVDDVEDRKVALNQRIVTERGEKILSDLVPAFGKNSQRVVVSNNYITRTGIINYLLTKKGLEI